MKYFFHRDVLLSVLFVFLITFLLKLLVFNVEFLNPFSNALKDFKFTDIYYSRLKPDQSSMPDTNVVVVNIGHNSREEIARQVEIINRFNPEVVAIDATFEQPRSPEEDSLLKVVIGKYDNIVLASYFISDQDGLKKLVQSAEKFRSKAKEGFANFPSTLNQKTIRSFVPKVNYKGEEVLSFSSQIVKMSDKEAYSKLMERTNRVEHINYKGNKERFIVIPLSAISENNQSLKLLEDKIVLLGFHGTKQSPKVLEDLHFTPMNPNYSGRSNPDMYGVVIQANIISMILEGRYLSRIPSWLTYVLAFVILYLHMFVFVKFYIFNQIWYDVLSRVSQIFMSIFLVGIEILIFAVFGWTMQMAIILVPVLLSLDVLFVYDGIAKYLNKKIKYKTLFADE